MNGNKLLFCCTATLGLALASTQAAAQAVPAMSGVQEVQVQHARVGNSAATGACGTSSGEIAADVLKVLKGDNIPAFSVIDAPPPRMGVARIDLIPEIITLQQQGLTCTSWISLFAQSRGSIRVPPVETPRNITALYWRGGLMISTTQAGHPRALTEAFGKLALQFSRQYRMDQPPPLPDFSDTK